jgi:microcystin-dependent protein
MSNQFVGEIRMFGGNFAINGWAFCNGQLMPITQNETLFALIGTTYGGDGVTTFALPDLRGRVPIHFGSDPNGNTYIQGELAGVENVTLNANQLPSHSHAAQASSAGSGSSDPTGNVWASSAATKQYAASSSGAMAATALGATGQGLPHTNIMPVLAVSFIIALFGIFPSRN